MRSFVLGSIGASLVVSALFVSACSILFDATPSAPDADAMKTDGPGADAGAALHCGPHFADTLAYFSVEGTAGHTSFNSVIGDYQALSRQNNASSPITVVPGPHSCGEAVSFESNESPYPYIAIDHHPDFTSIRSIDFWFNSAQAENNMSLLDKKRLNSLPESLAVFFVKKNDVPLHVTVALWTVAERIDRCSVPLVKDDTWHHLAISLDGFEAFLDGEQMEETYPTRGHCKTVAQAMPTETLANNDGDWFWGAAKNSVIDSHFAGAVDELRFRSARFTEVEANDVYQASRAPSQ